jgi:hypothetical protein
MIAIVAIPVRRQLRHIFRQAKLTILSIYTSSKRIKPEPYEKCLHFHKAVGHQGLHSTNICRTNKNCDKPASSALEWFLVFVGSTVKLA